MTVIHVQTVAFCGIDDVDIDVHVAINQGLPAFNIVGLPDKAVAESKKRIRSAIASIGISMPPKRITINILHLHLWPSKALIMIYL